jgi:hypothetical protein
MKIKLDPKKWYYNIDGDLWEFESRKALDDYLDSHKWGYLMLFKEPLT